MDIRSQLIIRTKKLGVLIRDARVAERRSIKECADAMGIKTGVLRAYEEGRRAPSLPELEILAHYLKLRINHFWGQEVMSDAAAQAEPLNAVMLLSIRQRKVGAILRQERNRAEMSLKVLSDKSGISVFRIKSFELGEKAIPMPELEALVAALDIRMDNFFDQSGPVGQWMNEQRAMQKFLDLPEEMQNFVCQPVNLPYIQLAIKLSNMSKDRLRSVAEGLLDITL